MMPPDTSAARRTVGDVMRRWFIELPPEVSLGEAERIMRAARIRHLPVVQDGILLGLLSYGDVLREWIHFLCSPEPAGRAAELDERPVHALMAACPDTLSREHPIRDAAARMCASSLGFLPVVEPEAAGPRVVGLVTQNDLLRAACEPPGTPPRD